MRRWVVLASLMSAFYCVPALGQETEGYGPGYAMETKEDASLETTVRYTTAHTWIYQAPDLTSPVIGMIEGGTKVDMTTDTGEWSCIVLEDGALAYVPSVYLSPEAAPDHTERTNRWGISLTPGEFDMLCRIVMLEAGGEPGVGQQAVAEVVCNRIVDIGFPDTLQGVLSAKGQFTPYKRIYTSSATPTPEVIDNVWKVLNGDTAILPFTTVYFGRRAQNGRVQARIGRHTFCNK